jgi:DNA-directed RNA polymerase alpha subunit
MSFVNMRQFHALKLKVADLEARLKALEGHSAGEEPPAIESVPSIEEAVEAARERHVSEVFDARVANILEEAGFTDVRLVREASDEELIALSGIAAATVENVRKKLNALDVPEDSHD